MLDAQLLRTNVNFYDFSICELPWRISWFKIAWLCRISFGLFKGIELLIDAQEALHFEERPSDGQRRKG